ncbi:MAG: hypothetical protein CM15mP54_20950 [Paracoccaceae bacterium]|nr:MAG: hypothetical protein CM15mP54_20950 [Paracoccaceae bacterium]
MADDGVRLVNPHAIRRSSRGVTYDAGVSRKLLEQKRFV